MFISHFLEIYSNQIVINTGTYLCRTLYHSTIYVTGKNAPHLRKVWNATLFFKVKLHLVEANTSQEWWREPSICPARAGFEDLGRASPDVTGDGNPIGSHTAGPSEVTQAWSSDGAMTPSWLEVQPLSSLPSVGRSRPLFNTSSSWPPPLSLDNVAHRC